MELAVNVKALPLLNAAAMFNSTTSLDRSACLRAKLLNAKYLLPRGHHCGIETSKKARILPGACYLLSLWKSPLQVDSYSKKNEQKSNVGHAHNPKGSILDE